MWCCMPAIPEFKKLNQDFNSEARLGDIARLFYNKTKSHTNSEPTTTQKYHIPVKESQIPKLVI